MIYAELYGNYLPVMTNTEMQTWVSGNPTDGQLVFNTDSGSFWRYDAATEAAVELSPRVVKVADTTAPASGNEFINSGLVGAVVKAVSRNGIGIKVVTTGAANGVVHHDAVNGKLVLGPDDAYYGEWLQVHYSGLNNLTGGHLD